ncbi:MAG: ACT domain-containing protein, partial [Candidatus Margulisbacteria bacterium]|nr:ACT domain-containing protein [Candidatus Margulisiibacteriota bacterium]
VGETMFYGRGAGEMPTASAVVGDIVDIAMHYDLPEAETTITETKQKVLPIGQSMSQFFIRLSVKDQPGVLAAISSVFGKNKVSIKLVSQHDTVKQIAELVIVTHSVSENNFNKAIKMVAKIPTVKKVESVIRVGLDEKSN